MQGMLVSKYSNPHTTHMKEHQAKTYGQKDDWEGRLKKKEQQKSKASMEVAEKLGGAVMGRKKGTQGGQGRQGGLVGGGSTNVVPC